MISGINAQLAATGVTVAANAKGTFTFTTALPADYLTFSTPTTNATNFLTQTAFGSQKKALQQDQL